MAWGVAGALVTLSLVLVVLSVRKGDAAAGPAMGNAGNASSEQAQSAASSGTPPDISAMTPRERFDRLFNRIMTASSSGDSTTVVNFTPMGLQAYSQLPSADTDADARYHAALLHAQVGDFAAARALADTIARLDRSHLFAPLIRGTVAELASDPAALKAAVADFLVRWDTEMAKGRPEYQDHKQSLDAFRAKAGRAR